MKGFGIRIRLRRKFIYFSFVILVILYYTVTFRSNENNNDVFNNLSVNKNEKKEEDPVIINDEVKVQLDGELVHLLLNDTIALKNGNDRIDSMIKKMILNTIQKPLEPDEFDELRKREEFHTKLWRMEFGPYKSLEDPHELMKYRNTLIEESAFLSQKHGDDLYRNKKLLNIIHQSLYPWLYGYRYNSLSDIISSSNGRGIVICTGNHHFNLAISTIDTLRYVLNSKLPIEVFYNGENDLSVDRRELLKEFENVYISDITNYFDNRIIDISSWAIKPFSILASRFEEVILIDADALYLRDPIELFKEKGYQEKGTLFFRDRTLFPGSNSASKWLKSWMYDPLPETKELRFWNELTEHEMESSTVVIHKTKTLLGLLNVCKLNEKIIRQDVVYRKVYGDKETYWIGFDMSRQPYYMSHKPCAFVGEVTTDDINSSSDDRRICGHTAHSLENGKLIFWNGHIVKDKNIGMYKEELIKFEAYAFEDEDNDWSINLACLNLRDTKEPIYFDDEELK
eukprot:jgi/Orpsp1_1/1190985/evm.model.d7180000082675.1